MTALTLAAALAAPAGAISLDFGTAYRVGGSPWLSAGVSNVPLGRGTFSVSASNRAVEASATQGFSLPPAGAVSASASAAVTWKGGLRLTSGGTATLGPVALNLSGVFFTAGAAEVDPLAAWMLEPTDLRARGWNADLTARYRVSRTLIAVLGGEFGPQNNVSGGVEWRRDLTRVLPPAEGDDPEAEPATERAGTLALRLGARAGRGVLGVTGGVTYSTEMGLSLALDALAGPGTLGAVGSLSAADLLGEGSTTRLYLAYEPWRLASAPLRAGAEATLPAGPGTLRLDVRGGTGGLGARVGYSLPLGDDAGQ